MSKRFLLSLLTVYQKWISPALPHACRFYPSCSAYAYEAIEKYGIRRGCVLGMQRILRCHPFHRGGSDPLAD